MRFFNFHMEKIKKKGYEKREMKSRQKFLSVLVALCMCISLLPVTALAADGIVDINGVEYQDLQTALNALNSLPAGESKITLLQTVELPENVTLTINEEQSVVLDLAGQTLKSDKSLSRPIVNYGELTINATGGGEFICTNSEVYGMIDNYGVLTINGGKFTDNGNGDGASIKNRNATSIIEINDGVFRATGTENTGNACVYNDGLLTIRKGDFQNLSGQSGVYCVISNSGTINIDAEQIGDVKINGNKGGIGINSGKAEINNVDVKCNHYHALWITNDGVDTNAVVNGGKYEGGLYGLYATVDDGGQDESPVKILITDGEFSGKTAAALGQRFTNQEWNLLITGGIFSSDVSEYIDKNAIITETDGSFKVEMLNDKNAAAEVGSKYYKSLSDAIAAAGDNETVKLLRDTSESVSVAKDKKVTLDLNGKNITSTTGCAIINKGELTVIGAGNVSTTASESAAIANFPGALCNVNGGTYKSYNWYVIKNLGEMVIDGEVTVTTDNSTNPSSLIDNGWVNATDKVAGENVSPESDSVASLKIKNGNFNGTSGEKSCSVVKNDDYGVLVIDNGTFNSTSNSGVENATTILNWNKATINGGTFTGSYPISNGNCHDTHDVGEVEINGGTFTGTSSIFGQNLYATNEKGKVTVNDGYFKAPNIFGTAEYTYKTEITGGHFTANPSAYLAEGKVAVASTEAGYSYTVADKETVGETEVTPAPDAAPKPVVGDDRTE